MSETKGVEELNKVLQCLKINGYEYIGTSESSDSGMSVAEFKKDVSFTTATGEYHNDSFIKVNVEFDDFFDHKNMGTEDHDDPDYLKYDAEKSDVFVQSLLDETYGGKKRTKRNKTKKNKTKRNKSKRNKRN